MDVEEVCILSKGFVTLPNGALPNMDKLLEGVMDVEKVAWAREHATEMRLETVVNLEEQWVELKYIASLDASDIVYWKLKYHGC